MPGYIPKLWIKLKYQMPTKPQYSPYLAPTITYRNKIQHTITDESPILDKQGNNLVRSIIGAALFISRFINMTLLVSCNKIALQQTDATTSTLNICT